MATAATTTKDNGLVKQVVGIGVSLIVIYIFFRVASAGWNSGKN